MTARLDQFNSELDQLLGLRSGTVTVADPALQSATVLLALDLEAESTPPAELRARWVSRTKISASPERKSFMQTLRARPALAILFAILALLLLTGAAYAIGKSLGYIPGIGLVETSSLRVLAEPVSQTRDGITITVNDVVLSSNKTIIAFTVDNIPFEKLSREGNDHSRCIMNPYLKLPDSATLQITGGQSNGWVTGYKSRFTYPFISTDVNEATLFIPCIIHSISGAMPENWEFPLRFVPAPTDMTALPVMEYPPSPEPESSTNQPNPIAVTKVIDLGDSYILIGEFTSPVPPDNTIYNPPPELILTDGNGKDMVWDYPQDIDLPVPSSDKPFTQAWAAKIAKGFTPPLNIKYSIQYSYSASPAAPLEFEFDAGENPQPGDEWQLNKEFNAGGYVFTLTTIRAVEAFDGGVSGVGYEFSFASSKDEINSVSIDIEGHAPPVGSGGYCDCSGSGKTWGSTLHFAELPKGKLKVTLSPYFLSEPQEWTLQWQP